MIQRIWTITRLTFVEAVRRRIAIAAIVLGLLFLSLSSIGFYYIQKETLPSGARVVENIMRRQVYNVVCTAGLYAIGFMAIAMSALVSADTLSGEITSGTIQVIATKPVHRWEVVFGKWFAFALLLALYLLALIAAFLSAVYLLAQYVPPNLAAGVALMYLQILLVLCVSIALSSRLSTLATGGTVFGLYIVSMAGGWIEQLGAFVKNDTAVNIGIVSSLLFPCDSLWRLASYHMTSPFLRTLQFYAGPFSISSVPSGAMVAYAAVYSFAALAIGIRHFNRRDL